MDKEKVEKGDIIIHGLLGQVWLIKERKGKLIGRIISEDSGQGYEELVECLGLFEGRNNTKVIGNIYNTY
jgi:hypothetical protein